jgi:RHS repeat-associated protein
VEHLLLQPGWTPAGRAGNGTRFYLTDALGSVLANITNAAGGASVKGNQVFGPYGNGRYFKGDINTAKGFTGQYNDGLTGLDYYNARYYDPKAGVFLSADSVQGNGSGENPYAYVGGNPETFSDPTGQMPCTAAGACGWPQPPSGGITGSGASGPPPSFFHPPSTGGSSQGGFQPCLEVGCMSAAKVGVPTTLAVQTRLRLSLGSLTCGFICVILLGGVDTTYYSSTTELPYLYCPPPFTCDHENGRNGGGDEGISSGHDMPEDVYPSDSGAVNESDPAGAAGNSGETTPPEGDRPVNSKNVPYPKVIDPRTGKEMPFPEGNLQKVAKADKVDWTKANRREFITEWHNLGYPRPEGGWDPLDIHHILPREYGGTNDFWNLIPVDRTFHQDVINEWWRYFIPS